jgi:hypothetical protein
MVQFINHIKGLKTNHINESPLFEKVYIPPDYGSRQVSRLYPDGSFYMMNLPRQIELETGNESWGFISSIVNEGVESIKRLLIKCRKCKNDNIQNKSVKGIEIWRFLCKNEIFEVVNTVLPETKNEIFNHIEQVIDQYLQPIPPDPE